MAKIYLLYDCPSEINDKQWLTDGFIARGHEVCEVQIHKNLSRLGRSGGFGHLRVYVIMLWQCVRALAMSRNEDVIICWNFVTGLALNFLSKISGNRHHMILMNWLSPSFRKRIIPWHLKKFAAVNHKCRMIVNSPDSGKRWMEHLKLLEDRNFYYIPDVYNTKVPFGKFNAADYERREKYCFTGGMNNRDWRLLVQIAWKMPDINFICVALKEDWEKQVHDTPKNVKVYFGLETDLYYKLMAEAGLILLPLERNKVSGLINIIRASQYGVLCLVTDYDATRQYYPLEERELLLSNCVEDWVAMIRSLLRLNGEEMGQKVNRISEYIQNKFSPDSAMEVMEEIINEI